MLSEVKIGIVRRRRDSRNMIGQDRAEARARLDPRIPFLGRLVSVPGYVAHVIEARQLGRGGNVGDREMDAREPAATFDQIADIVEMVRQIRVTGTNRL